jgi:hypothetical protein
MRHSRLPKHTNSTDESVIDVRETEFSPEFEIAEETHLRPPEDRYDGPEPPEPDESPSKEIPTFGHTANTMLNDILLYGRPQDAPRPKYIQTDARRIKDTPLADEEFPTDENRDDDFLKDES